jgi:hypothetical protein
LVIDCHLGANKARIVSFPTPKKGCGAESASVANVEFLDASAREGRLARAIGATKHEEFRRALKSRKDVGLATDK